MVKVYAVIVTYNGEKWIQKCLSSLRASTISIDTIVIDNYSTDNTINIIEKDFSKTTLIKSEKNLGFGKANNKGVKVALSKNADYVFLLNQDAWVEKDTIDSLVKVAENNPDYGVLSGVHLNGEGNQLDYGFSKYLAPEWCPSFVSDLYLERQNLQEVYKITFVNAAAWLIKKDCLLTVGGFDPLFYHYGEDVDYINRVHYHGYKVGICPKVTICHDRSNDPREMKIASSTKQRVFMQLLYVMKDINQALPKMYWVAISRAFKVFVDRLFIKDTKRAADAISLMLKATFSLPKVYKSRKKSKIKGKSYLK